jgi:fucose 4-O-acetylase-like acetyltransferase
MNENQSTVAHLDTGGIATASRSPAAKRRQEIELLRVVGAFGIVCYHTLQVGRSVAYAGLIAFLIISMFFAARSGASTKNVWRRARALLVPWLVWFVFYGVLNIVQHRPFISLQHGWITGVLAGTSIHLWYLPFIFLCTLLFDLVKDKVPAYLLSCVCLVLAASILISWPLWRGPTMGLNYPYAQYAHALAGVLIGVYFANCRALPELVAVYLISEFFFVCLLALPSPGIGFPYLLGVMAAALTLLPRWELPARFDISFLSECTFGIYLSHIFWLRVVRSLLPIDGVLMPFLVFVLAAVSVFLFKRYLPQLARYAV